MKKTSTRKKSKKKRKNDYESNIWTHEQSKEVFLCIAEKLKTQREIREETKYSKGRVSKIKTKLETEGLIVKLPEKKYIGRKPGAVYDINPEFVFGKMIIKKGYTDGEFKHVVEEFKELPNLVRPYLQTIARHPLWRKDHCGNKEISDWAKYKKSLDTEFNLSTVGDYFIDYLLVNERKLAKKLKRKQRAKFASEVNEFIRWIRLSGNHLMLHYLQDKNL